MPAISFSGGIAADMGSTNTYIILDKASNVYKSASCALVDAVRQGEVYALGDEAKRLEGRSSDEALVVSPISYGAVADTETAALLLLSSIEKASGRRKLVDKSRLYLTVPCMATKVERTALATAAELTGAKHITVIQAPVAAAVALKRHVEKAEASLVVSIGSHITEISVISSGGVVLSRGLKRGSNEFDKVICDYVRKNTGLLISEAVACELKEQMGSAVTPETDMTQTLSGRSVKTGRPLTASVSAREIAGALQTPVSAIIDSISDALCNIPVEFTSDILKSGIALTGGGSMLYSLAQKLEAETGLDVYQSDESAFDTVRGAFMLANDDRLLRCVMNAYSAYEI